MNGNLPHAAGVIHAVLGSVRPEQATAVAHALDSARLLVDPERSFGTVLHRTPGGGWTRTPQAVTDLERQALAWDTSCARARSVAHAIERRLVAHRGPSGVRVDGDRVRVVLRVEGPAQWADWRAFLGVTVVGEGARSATVVGEGERGGVRVTVTAHGAAASASGAAGLQAYRYRLFGVAYDLTLPLRDAHGDVWYFQGCRRHDGMPLMSLDGRPERCSLANVAAHLGPLAPVRTAMAGEGSAERAALPPPSPLPPAVPVGGSTGPVG
ncbi:BN159_2729 family protein [Streptomyces sp. NPDC126514]|uniref:BN159_2729 family protein n=1 Tax=Streptomyces sp. NPDC126514 TaxID=3155210 RepID=UPI00331BEFD6